MIDSPEAAIRAMSERARRLDAEEVAVEEWLGRVLAEPVVADRPSPAASVSAMDGFALRTEDVGLGRLPVRREVRIGKDPGEMEAGTAVRVVTGAAVPRDANVVVKVEDVEFAEDRITIPEALAEQLKPWLHVRRKGENLKEGGVALETGALITPAVVGAMATFGRQAAQVRKRVRVVVIVTGDELKAASEEVSEYELRDSNGPAVHALLGARPWIDVVGQARVGDDPAMIRTAMQKSLERCDMVVMTGGVSMGTRDFVPGLVSEVGAEVIFHKLPQRPGKPMLGAAMLDGRLIFGLPGNPVSSMVTTRRIVIPVAAAMAGLDVTPPANVTLSNDDGEELDLWWHRIVKMVGPGRAALVFGKGSGDVPAAARSDGFVEIPIGASGAGPWPMYFWS